MTAAEVERLTCTVIGCWNRSDWSSYRALTGPGYVYEEAGTGRRITDTEAVLVAWVRLRTAFPDATVEIVQLHAEDDVAVAGVIWRATQTGPLHTDVGSPSYKKLQVWDLITMHWQHRRVVSERHDLGFLSLVAPLLEGPTGTCRRGASRRS